MLSPAQVVLEQPEVAGVDMGGAGKIIKKLGIKRGK